MKYLKKISIFDVAICSVFFSFLLAYLGIAHYNRAMQDDFNTYSRAKSLGIIVSGTDYYRHFEGAVVWFLWPHLLVLLNQFSTHLFFINLLNISLLFTSLFLLLSQVIKKLLPFYSFKIPLYLCILTITSIFYFRKDIVQQAVFWFDGSGYMTLMSLLFTGIYFLLKKGFGNYIISAVLLFLFACVRLHYSLTELGILFYFLLWYFLENKKVNRRILVVFIIAMAGFAIYLAAPGNYVGRFSAASQEKAIHASLFFYMKLILKSLAYYGYMHILRRMPLLVLNLSLAFILGLLEEKNSITEKKFKAFAGFSLYTLVISWMALAVVMAISFQNWGNTRTFFFPLLLTVFLLNLNLYFSGMRFRQKFQIFAHLTLPIGFAASGFFMYIFFSDISNLKKFDMQYDQRIASIVQAKNSLTTKDTLYLTALPHTRTLMDNELRGGVYLQWEQDALMKYFETAFQIKLVPIRQ